MEFILEQLGSFVINVIDETGYWGIFALMVLEGSFFPLPSEIILPFSGYLVSQGRFGLTEVALVGALGNIVGTMFTYGIARYIGITFLRKYGKYVLVTNSDIDMATRLFDKFGKHIIFISRLLPGVRGFVPIPAGIARMKLLPFVAYVFVGSFIWSYVLAYVGVKAGENWDVLNPYYRKFDWLLLALLVAFVVWWIRRHIKITKQEKINL